MINVPISNIDSYHQDQSCNSSRGEAHNAGAMTTPTEINDTYYDQFIKATKSINNNIYFLRSEKDQTFHGKLNILSAFAVCPADAISTFPELIPRTKNGDCMTPSLHTNSDIGIKNFHQMKDGTLKVSRPSRFARML
jgi:hypothetical protein